MSTLLLDQTYPLWHFLRCSLGRAASWAKLPFRPRCPRRCPVGSQGLGSFLCAIHVRKLVKVRLCFTSSCCGRRLCPCLKTKDFYLAVGHAPISYEHWHGPSSDGSCVFCVEPEDANHIFFTCVPSKMTWSYVWDISGLPWKPQHSVELTAIMCGLRCTPRRVILGFMEPSK